MSGPTQTPDTSQAFDSFELEAAQRLTTTPAEAYRDPFLDGAIYRFTPEDLATFYTASFAFQASDGFLDLPNPQARYLETELGKSQRHIVTASVDALLREFLSAGEGGTVIYDTLHEDHEVQELANGLASNMASKYVTEKTLAMRSLRTHLSEKDRLIPSVIINTLFGIRVKLSELHSEGRLTDAALRELAADVGHISSTLFGAIIRDLKGEGDRQSLAVAGSRNWLDFAKAVFDFGKNSGTNADIMIVDRIVHAQHANDTGGGKMLIRTCSNFQEVVRLLDAKESQSKTQELKKRVPDHMQRVLELNPQINLFA